MLRSAKACNSCTLPEEAFKGSKHTLFVLLLSLASGKMVSNVHLIGHGLFDCATFSSLLGLLLFLLGVSLRLQQQRIVFVHLLLVHKDRDMQILMFEQLSLHDTFIFLISKAFLDEPERAEEASSFGEVNSGSCHHKDLMLEITALDNHLVLDRFLIGNQLKSTS